NVLAGVMGTSGSRLYNTSPLVRCVTRALTRPPKSSLSRTASSATASSSVTAGPPSPPLVSTTGCGPAVANGNGSSDGTGATGANGLPVIATMRATAAAVSASVPPITTAAVRLDTG